MCVCVCVDITVWCPNIYLFNLLKQQLIFIQTIQAKLLYVGLVVLLIRKIATNYLSTLLIPWLLLSYFSCSIFEYQKYMFAFFVFNFSSRRNVYV